MNLHQALKQFLDENCSVKSRVYPIILPPQITLPAITYQEIANIPFMYLDGSFDEHSRFQITIWSSTIATSQKVAAQVNKLTGFQGRLSESGPCVSVDRLNKFDLPEPEAKKYRVVMEFLIKNDRAR